MFHHTKLYKPLLPFAFSILAGFSYGQVERTDSEENVLEMIIVTAQKREENLQDVAIAITAYDGRKLDQIGAYDAVTLGDFIPNVRIGNVFEAVVINARGIQSNDTTEIGDPAVAFNVDGVYYARPRGASALFYDLERVEFLRGPQGTLYGRNATAGSLNVVTKRPSNQLEAEADILYGNFDRLVARGVLNTPIIDNVLTARTAIYYQDRDGYNDNDNLVPSIESTGDADEIAGRLNILLTPVEDITVFFSGDYYESDSAGIHPSIVPGQIRNVVDASSPAGFRTITTTLEDRNDPRVFSLKEQPYQELENYGLKLDIRWDMENATAVFVGAYRSDEANSFKDTDERFNLVELFPTPAGVFPVEISPLDGGLDAKSEQHSYELRLESDSTDLLSWIIGGYYFEEEQSTRLFFDSGPVTVLEFDYGDTTAESIAGFGQVSYDLTDTLEAVLGARYTSDERSRRGTVLFFGPAIAEDNSAEFSNFDWKVGLNWKFDATALAYFSLGTGYKAGGFNAVAASGLGPVYSPEEVLALETGIKMDMFDARLRLNAAAFYYDYSDIQVSTVDVSSGGLATRNTDGDIWGAEIEAIGLLPGGAQLEFNIGYLNTEYTGEFLSQDSGRTFDNPCLGSPPGTCAETLKGNELPNAPEISINLALQQEISLGNIGRLVGRIQTHYESDSFLREFNRRIDERDSYTKTDIRLTYYSSDERYTIEVFADNLEDEAVPLATIGSGADLLVSPYSAPRTYGLRVGVKY